jgi:hypothetical protein
MRMLAYGPAALDRIEKVCWTPTPPDFADDQALSWSDSADREGPRQLEEQR